MMTSRQERKKIWDQIKRLSSKLDTISSQVNRITQAIDSFEMYRYQYNQYNTINIVGIPQVAERASRRHTLTLFEAIFSCVGADITNQNNDIVNQVPAKSAQASRPNPIICKFVRRLPKQKSCRQ